MIRLFATICIVLSALLAVGCSRAPIVTEGRRVEPYIPESGSVGFDIAPVQGNNGSNRWLATYTSQGKTARFRIEFGPAKASDSKDAEDFPVSFGAGRIMAEPGSDPSALLADLKKALEAKQLPTKVQRMNSLQFTYASIGTNMSQAPDGGFLAEPPGNWTAIKIFIGEGDQECEFFLNINSVLKKGQFSIKDADYGDIVLSQLAKVL